ncbi:MAG: type ISP restriction/modification enzyme [Bacteroidales bacterium]|jgi:predicted helicase|nr:type ISP restriction/modification enzyme [Bacteroidales bacterium]
MLKQYLASIQNTLNRGDAREENYYGHLKDLLLAFVGQNNYNKVEITILPKQTEAGNPDFRVWDGKNHITGYIEAKDPSVTNLDKIENSEQLKRYISTFPNVILTNFYEFRLYRNGDRIKTTTIARYAIAKNLNVAPPVENTNDFYELLDTFFSFSLPKVNNAKNLAVELANRTRFLRDEVVSIEMAEELKKGQKAIRRFYEAFQKYLIGTLTEKTFADLYSQTITYGLFAARTRANDEFNRELAFKYIPQTIGILRDIFRFISLEDAPKSLQIIVDDIAEILQVTDVKKILQDFYLDGKGQDPIVHFYETFLSQYDPKIRKKRGVYYTPEPIVNYIVRSINDILKTHFDIADGLAGKEVTLLDPAAGTLTFPAEAIKLAINEYTDKYGTGGKENFIKNHILEDFYAFELMMAPYAIGHLKISFLFDELGYKMSNDERFKLYLTNTLEKENLDQTIIPGLSSLSEESHLACEVKKDKPILVILGNPPYSGISANINEWTEQLLKKDINGALSYYKVDGMPLGEKKLWLQDDYVKFIRFAQCKIHKAGQGIVGMITNHSYLDNLTFRGMRQSLMNTFNEIYLLDLHGNALKKEKCPDGSKDENVFDIRQGVVIAIFVKQKNKEDCRVYHKDLYGMREAKYQWLLDNNFDKKNYTEIRPASPEYFFIPRNIEDIKYYEKWDKINDIFPVNGVGIVTANDNLAIDFTKEALENKIRIFRNKNIDHETIRKTFKIKDNNQWNLSKQRERFMQCDNWMSCIKKILYRPFDIRYIIYHDDIIARTRKNLMSHMLNENLGLITTRFVFKKNDDFCHAFITNNIIDINQIQSPGTAQIFPLYLYTEQQNNTKTPSAHTMMLFERSVEYHTRQPNIDKSIYEKLNKTYNKHLTPKEILFYVYAVLYSNIYRKKYADFLKIDFPRIPFAKNYKLFNKMSTLGNKLVDLHLMKSKELDNVIAKYEGEVGTNKIEKVEYNEKKKRIYINNDKYFTNVSPQLWNYHIGGYQVLYKFLKDRKNLNLDNPEYYCKIITAINKTMDIQKQIDKLYPLIEKNLYNI